MPVDRAADLLGRLGRDKLLEPRCERRGEKAGGQVSDWCENGRSGSHPETAGDQDHPIEQAPRAARNG